MAMAAAFLSCNFALCIVPASKSNFQNMLFGIPILCGRTGALQQSWGILSNPIPWG